MSVGRICQRDVDLASGDESVFAAAERMHQRTVGCLMVLNELGQPVGIVTDRDLVVRVLAAGKDPHMTTVAEAMTPEPRTISEDTPIERALSLMRSGAFRRLPVVGRRGELLGIVTLDDILVLIGEEMAHVGRLLERETPRAAAAL